jgi:hypothetical protein
MSIISRAQLGAFCDILEAYAVAGVRFWNGQPLRAGGQGLTNQQRNLASVAVSNKVIDDEPGVRAAVTGLRQGKVLQENLIPIPLLRQTEFQVGFFRPTICAHHNTEGHFVFSYTILLWVAHKAAGKTIAYRIERQDNPTWAHSFPHAQICKSVVSPSLQTSLFGDVPWLPTSYPAFPLRGKTAYDFLCGMLISLHGYAPAKPDDYALGLLKEALSQATRLNRWQMIEGKMRKFSNLLTA